MIEWRIKASKETSHRSVSWAMSLDLLRNGAVGFIDWLKKAFSVRPFIACVAIKESGAASRKTALL